MSQNLLWCEVRAFLCPKPFRGSRRAEGIFAPVCGMGVAGLGTTYMHVQAPHLFELTGGKGSCLNENLGEPRELGKIWWS